MMNAVVLNETQGSELLKAAAADSFLIEEVVRMATERRETLHIALVIIGSDLLQDLMRLRNAKRKKMLEDLAAEGDEACAVERWELFGGDDGSALSASLQYAQKG